MYKFIEQRDTTDALVELMKDITISNSDKEKIYNTIMMFRNTPKQQDRFVRANKELCIAETEQLYD